MLYFFFSQILKIKCPYVKANTFIINALQLKQAILILLWHFKDIFFNKKVIRTWIQVKKDYPEGIIYL